MFLFNIEVEYEDYTDQTMKVIVIYNVMAEKDTAEIAIVIEGNQVLAQCGNQTKACMLLMGLIYALNREYPQTVKKFSRNFSWGKASQEGLQPQK